MKKMVYAALKATKKFDCRGIDAFAFIVLFITLLMSGIFFCKDITDFVLSAKANQMFLAVMLLSVVDVIATYGIIWLAHFVYYLCKCRDWSDDYLTGKIVELR